VRPDVALVGTYPPLGVRHGGITGVASYTANLASALSNEGANVVVIAPEEDGQPATSKDGRVRIERRYRRGSAALPSATAAAVSTDAAVAHVQFEVFLFGGPSSLVQLPGSLRQMRQHLGTVATLHQVVDPSDVDSDFTALHRVRVPPPMAKAGLGGVQTAVRRFVDHVVVHEPSFAKVVPGARVIPHGVELTGAPDQATARRRLGITTDRMLVLCFGFVAPYKGLETALAAAELAHDDVELVIAGGEHPRLAGKDSYAHDLRRRWGHEARFTGFVAADDVPLWFAAADLALYPYPRPFSSSGALALALAYDRPVLMSQPLADATGAPADLAAPVDPVGLAVRLREIANRPGSLAALRASSRALAEGREWPHVARMHLSLYEEVIDGHAAPGRRVRAGEPW